jgi:hypothetical protein
VTPALVTGTPGSSSGASRDVARRAANGTGGPRSRRTCAPSRSRTAGRAASRGSRRLPRRSSVGPLQSLLGRTEVRRSAMGILVVLVVCGHVVCLSDRRSYLPSIKPGLQE